MSAREQQLEAELALTRAMVRARLESAEGSLNELERKLSYLRKHESAQRRVAAWRPYDD